MPELIPQAGVIPYRRSAMQVEFCLITSVGGQRWGFPKGIIEHGDTPTETALKEAHEEAGLVGTIVGEPLGEYQYQKWGTTLEVTVFLMEVSRADDEWDECEIRQRDWLPAHAAAERIDRPELSELLQAAVLRLSDELPANSKNRR